ncbi:hypothetical protein CEQ90_18495 [Lewinellaceae bacterium SD302]|nr:hypothetical protein CEQ90_18495 [Lewinellaceae bacterium SD302]
MFANYLESCQKQFRYYQLLGDRTFAQLSDEQLTWAPGPNSNSIAVIVKHLRGNMLSRWTDLLHSDGEKEWRQRDQEFEADLSDRAAILSAWSEGWTCLFTALAGLDAKDADKLVYIRNQGHTIPEAVNRQLAHYAYHVGQIVYLGRLQTGNAWKSLSIPKGDSATYNAEKFSREKERGHFTDEFL